MIGDKVGDKLAIHKYLTTLDSLDKFNAVISLVKNNQLSVHDMETYLSGRELEIAKRRIQT